MFIKRSIIPIKGFLLFSILINTIASYAANSLDQKKPSFEIVPSGESSDISTITIATPNLQDKRVNLPGQNGKRLRGVHPKSHGCVDAKFEINKDIKKEFRRGLFKTPGEVYKAKIRFSNASVTIDDDLEKDGTGMRQNGSRGMAIKVFNVKGKIIERDKKRKNQDFLMINTPEFAFASVRGYKYLTEALLASEDGTNPNNLLGLVFVLAKINQWGVPFPQPTEEDLGKLNSVVKGQGGQLPAGFALQDLQELTTTLNIVLTKIRPKTVRNPLQVQYFGASSYLFGQRRAMKFSAVPDELVAQAKFNIPPENPSPDYLREDLARIMKQKQPIVYNFKIQVRNRKDGFGKNQELIENTSTTWAKKGISELDQYANVAKITISAPQDISSKKALQECKNLAFTPWHSLMAHKPIGGINRLRRSVYTSSAAHRGTK